MDCRFCCPKCKGTLELKNTSYNCSDCNRSYLIHDGYTDFLEGQVNFYPDEVPEANMKKLLQDIDSMGFVEGVRRLYVDYPHLREYIGSERRADWICHCFGRNNNRRCLDIGSGLGNLSEMLSHYYGEVYSLEAVPERIEFQKRRFKNSNVNNVTIVRANGLQLPFPDRYFDLVVCNGVLKWIGTMNTTRPPREVQLSFLLEVKRVLSDEGCLYIGTENRFGGAANFLVKRYSRSAAISPDTSSKEKEEKESRGYCTHSIIGYNSILREAGFKFKSYWVFPSYNKPVFSARVNDTLALKGFMHYIGSRIGFNRLFSIMGKFNSRILSLISNTMSPSFLFYCYKNEIQESIDDIITNAAQLRSYCTTGEGHNIRYLLFDTDGMPSKIAQVTRYSNEIPKVIPFYNKEVPSANQPQERIWFENWVPGRRINLLSSEQTTLAVEWLFDFQNKTKTTIMTEEDVSLEIAEIRRGLSNLPMFDRVDVEKWLNDYHILSQKLNIVKAAQHGDFWHGNILFDPKTKKLHVIDWEYYKENSNPLYDFVYFIMRGMKLPNESPEDFRNNLLGHGQFSPALRALVASAKEHFGAEFDLNVLMPYVLLQYVSTKSLELKQDLYRNNLVNEDLFDHVAKLLRILSSHSSPNLIKSQRL